jgi:hypothetical protein
MQNSNKTVANKTSLFLSLGGQRRGPGANYRKKFGHVVVFFNSVLTFVPSSAFAASLALSQPTEISRSVAEEFIPIVCANYSFCDGQVSDRSGCSKMHNIQTPLVSHIVFSDIFL